jgi:predicted RND superfamily exporter protein
MVELANQIRKEEDCTRQVAIVKAAPQRLRPIVMTTVTTILGLFPLALGIGEGSEFLQPLGIVVFFGMAIATMLTLFIIPCFYILLHDLLGGNWTKPISTRLSIWNKKLYKSRFNLRIPKLFLRRRDSNLPKGITKDAKDAKKKRNMS